MACAAGKAQDCPVWDLSGKARMVGMTTVGTFAYHCDFHPFMKATVIVK